MAVLVSAPARAQYGAMAQMRWRMLVNSLRQGRGKFELGARIFWTGSFLLIWVVIGFGLGALAWEFTSNNHLKLLSALLWPLFLMWQMIPVMLSSFQENVDLSVLLRFPVSFSSYTLLYLFFGLFDLSSLLGAVALLGIWTGTVVARPSLAVWAALALALFGVFNLLLTRMIFAWIDRWLAQRKTREILGMVFLFLLLTVQLLNPALHQHSRQHGRRASSGQRSEIWRTMQKVDRVQSLFPPGLTARSIEMGAQGHPFQAVGALGWVSLYALGAAALLGLRLRAEYRGESLGEAPRRVNRVEAVRAPGGRPWAEGSGPIGAVLEKELHYLLRSGVMLYSMVAPLVVLFIFGGPSRPGHSIAAHYALPFGVAIGFLGLTRQMCNSLGGEEAGIQLYFLSPTRFRTVMLAKNLMQIGLFCVELVLACSIVFFRFGMPEPQLIAATLCWLLFALPVQLALGNVLSITMAYRMTLTRLSREQGASGNGLLSLLIQFVVFATGVGVFLALSRLGHAKLAAPVFLVLALAGVLLWLRVLSNVDRMAMGRREALIAALVRGT